MNISCIVVAWKPNIVSVGFQLIPQQRTKIGGCNLNLDLWCLLVSDNSLQPARCGHDWFVCFCKLSCAAFHVVYEYQSWMEKRMEKRMVVAGIALKPVMCFMFVGNRLVKKCGPKPQDLCTPCEPETFTVRPLELRCDRCNQCVGTLTPYLDLTLYKHYATSWSLGNCLTFYFSSAR